MILDILSHWKDYQWPSERFHKGFEYLEKFDPKTPDGRVDLDGDNVYVSVQRYETKPPKELKLEAHRQYADIQILLEGEESILWEPLDGLKVSTPYEPDIAFFEFGHAPTEIVLAPGRFSVFFPRDAHAPCGSYGKIHQVRKAVVKVRLA